MNENQGSTETLDARPAPRVTLGDIEQEIIQITYFTAEQGSRAAVPSMNPHPSLGLLTICVLVLTNGFTVVGKSACVSPENFSESIGRRIAYEDAVSQCWALLGFRLRDQLYAAKAQYDRA